MRSTILALLLALSSLAVTAQSLTFKNILDKPELATTKFDHKIAYVRSFIMNNALNRLCFLQSPGSAATALSMGALGSAKPVREVVSAAPHCDNLAYPSAPGKNR